MTNENTPSSKKIIIVCITKSHYQMALQILKEFETASVEIYSKIFCSGFLHDQKNKFCKETLNLFDENTFINDFQYVTNRWKTWKLRKIIRKINNEFLLFNPDIIIPFTDNGYIYQNSYDYWKYKAKIVLFHEGYGDYSDPTSTLIEALPYLYIKLVVWPYIYHPVTRSYTGLYDYSFLLEPDIVLRDFPFKKMQISQKFIKSIFFKERALKYPIKLGSIFFTMSGKDWANDSHLKSYLNNCIRETISTNRNIYIKVAPNVRQEDYAFLSDNDNVFIIDELDLTSESFCFHENFDYIVTDESSAVINAIYGGVKKTFFFLNSEIQEKGIFMYDNNDLVKVLQGKKIINQVSVSHMVKLINTNFRTSHFIDGASCNTVGRQLKEILND